MVLVNELILYSFLLKKEHDYHKLYVNVVDIQCECKQTLPEVYHTTVLVIML